MKSSKALEYLSNIRFLSDSMVLVCTKIQIRTIVLEYKMRAHIISPREGSNLFNVVILLAFKALLLDFLDLWGYKMDQKTHRLGLCRKGSVYLPKIKLYSFFGSPVKFYFLRIRTIDLDQLKETEKVWVNFGKCACWKRRRGGGEGIKNLHVLAWK